MYARICVIYVVVIMQEEAYAPKDMSGLYKVP